MTQAREACASWGKDRSSAGNATFTIERSSEAMKAPRAVTAKTTRRRLRAWRPATGPASVGSIMQLNLRDCVASCNPLIWGHGTQEFRRHGLLRGSVPRGGRRVVEHAHRAGCL